MIMNKLRLIICLCATVYSIALNAQSKNDIKNKVITEREFTELYVKSMSKNYPDADYKIISDLTVSADYRGKELTHYLDNAYKEYLMHPDALEDLIKKYVASSGRLYKDPSPINTSNIVPIIKPIEYLEDLKQLSKGNGGEKEPGIVYEKYNHALIIVYGENTETNIAYFTHEDFNKLSIPRDSLRALAVGNLNRVLPKIQKKGDNGTFMITAGGDFEASLILLTSIWTPDNFKVKGELVVAIPNRDMLMVTGSKDDQGIKMIQEITTESFATGNYQISPHLFKWDGAKFEMWK
jgi:uncharacterized protein YtpQ (UPF0354 family)